MRTNVTLDEALVSELLDLSGEKTKTAAVTAAVKEQIRRAKLKKLAGLLGRVEVDEAALREGNEADLARARRLEASGAGHGR
ncbi:MAG: hypothetical protein C4523_21185 [Myxococcales bacterium]|nr:MAG: hypothetical protein C4523_21185 [Myxococcales bacterium]